MFEKLQGSRTYIQAAALAFLSAYMALDDALNSLALYDLPDVPVWLLTLLGAGTAAALRAAKSPPQPPANT